MLRLIRHIKAWIWLNIILLCTYVYMLGILLYSFSSGTQPWVDFFWLDTCAIGIASLLFNLKIEKNTKELAHILFLAILKTFNILYYIIGIVIDSPERRWMNTNLFSLIAFAVASFLVFIKYKPWKKGI